MILANGCNITKSEKCKGVWILSVTTVYITFIYIALFWVLKALYMEWGYFLIHHQCSACTWWCDGSHISPERPPHTPVYWWRGDRGRKPISVWGWLGGHDGQRPMGKFGQNAGVTPLLFFEEHPGIFNDHRESGPQFNVSSEGYMI